MAKTQTRRSVSFSRPLYDQIAEAAASEGVPLARWVEAAVTAKLRAHAGSSQLDDVIKKLEATAPSDSGPRPVDLDAVVGVLPRSAADFDALLSRSSIGRGIANIKANGGRHRQDDDLVIEYDEDA